MDEGIKESITQAVKERLSSPLWGYILFSWISINWKNLAILFMSDKTVEDRISEISTQEWFYLEYFFTPIIIGVLLAILSPYFKQWLSVTHKRAEENQRKGIKKKITDKYDDDIEIADKKVAAENAENLAKEKENTKIIQEKEKQKRETFDTNSLEEKVASLRSQQRDIEISLRETITQKEEAHKEFEFWRNKSAQTIEIIKSYHSISGNSSLSEIKNKLSNLFSDEELEIAGYAVKNKKIQDAALKKNASEAIRLLTEILEVDNKASDNMESENLSANTKKELIETLFLTLKQLNDNTITPSERIASLRQNLKQSFAE